jgi:hypothetical protein
MIVRSRPRDGRSHRSVLLVPGRTPTLDADAKSMGLTWADLGSGYWRVTGGLFSLLVVEIERVAKQEGEDLLALFGYNEVHTQRAMSFWGELVGAEAKMDAQKLEGYEEAVQKIVRALTPEQRLAGLAPEQRMAGLPPEQRLAGLAPESLVLALPDDMLRKLSDDLLAGLSEDARAAIRKRIGHA